MADMGGANFYSLQFTYNRACESGLLVGFGYKATINKSDIKFRVMPSFIRCDGMLPENFILKMIEEYDNHSRYSCNIKTMSLRGLGLTDCNFINVLSVRDRIALIVAYVTLLNVGNHEMWTYSSHTRCIEEFGGTSRYQ